MMLQQIVKDFSEYSKYYVPLETARTDDLSNITYLFKQHWIKFDEYHLASDSYLPESRAWLNPSGVNC